MRVAVASSPANEKESTDRCWAVWRHGDDGNSFVVKENLTEEEADRLIVEMESRMHKQTYVQQRME
jgi:hypothetical protein